MDGDCNPIFGIVQPRYGTRVSLGSRLMPRTPSPEYVYEVRTALAINLRARMAAFYPDDPETTQAEKLGKAAGIGKNTVIRMLDEEADTNPRLDILVRIAHSLRMSVGDLLREHGKKNKKKPKAVQAVRTTAEPLKGALHRHSG